MVLLVEMARTGAVKKSAEGAKLEKPEDRAWNEWFSGLKEEDHKKHLAQLGLDAEDVEDWKEMHGHLDEIIETEQDAAEEAEKTKKRKK